MTANNKNGGIEKEIKEIKELLVKFQEGYIKRDKALAEEYMNDIFAKEDVVILGTSTGEWCLGYEEAKELVESDWEYWGDVRIDTMNPNVIAEDDVAWIAINGNLKYEFKDSEERYKGYVGLVEEHFKEGSEYEELSPEVKLTKIKMILAHTMGIRKEGIRTYHWPLRINGVLTKIDGNWKFKYMQFFLPNVGYPDARMSSMEEYIKENKDEYKKLKDYVKNRSNTNRNEIIDVLTELKSSYLENSISPKNIIEKYFVKRDDIRLVDGNDIWNVGPENLMESITSQRDKWDSINLEKELAVVDSENNVAWISVSGFVKKTITKNDAMMAEIESIKDICKKDLPSKDKLFQIHRNISRVMMETAIGEEHIWPIRLEGMLMKETDKWKFHSVQFSYPFYWILEGMYDVPAEE